MTSHLQLSIGVPNFGTWLGGGRWHDLPELGRMADDAGVDRIVVVDHVVMGPTTDAYRWGRFPTPPDGDWLEPLTVLAAVAAVTTRVRLATGILIPALRGAALLAKTAATLDVLSQGRLELGVAAGWQREEYDAVGVDWAQRGRVLDDTLAACHVLWNESPATFSSPTVSFAEVHCRPAPAQAGGVPVWIGGALSARNLARIVHWGHGWIPIMGATAEQVDADLVTIHDALVEAGRDPVGFHVQRPLTIVRDDAGAADLAATIASAASLAGRGPTAVHLPLQAFCHDLADAPAFFDEAVRRLAEVTGGA